MYRGASFLSTANAPLGHIAGQTCAAAGSAVAPECCFSIFFGVAIIVFMIVHGIIQSFCHNPMVRVFTSLCCYYMLLLWTHTNQDQGIVSTSTLLLWCPAQRHVIRSQGHAHHVLLSPQPQRGKAQRGALLGHGGRHEVAIIASGADCPMDFGSPKTGENWDNKIRSIWRERRCTEIYTRTCKTILFDPLWGLNSLHRVPGMVGLTSLTTSSIGRLRSSQDACSNASPDSETAARTTWGMDRDGWCL